MTYADDTVDLLMNGSVFNEVWHARDSLVPGSAWPSVLQDREPKERDRPVTQPSPTNFARQRTAYKRKFRPPSAPNPRLRPGSASQLNPTDLEPTSSRQGNTKDITAPQNDPKVAENPVNEKCEDRTSPEHQRSESRLSRVSGTSTKIKDLEETLQNPQAVTDPLICKSRLESSFKMFRLKTWRPYTASNSDMTRHTCRIRPHSSRYGTREAVLVREVIQDPASVDNNNEDMSKGFRFIRRPRSVPPHLLKGSFTAVETEEKKDVDSDIEDNELSPAPLGLVEASSPILSTQALTIMSSDYDLSCRSTRGEFRDSAADGQTNEETEEADDDKEADERSEQSEEVSEKDGKPMVTVSCESPIASDGAESSSDEDSEEEEEEVDEEEEGEERKTPCLDLPPEHYETEYGALEELPDPVRFDFDASTTPEPAFNYPQPLPAKVHNVNFRRLAENGLNWRQIDGLSERQFSDFERSLLDRIVDLERLQLSTEHLEQYRREQLRRAYRDHQEQVRRLRAQGMSPSRIASATRRSGGAGMGTSGSVTNRQCCSSCLQPACAGDCPMKTARPKVCVLCRQMYCDGSCAETSYIEHQRVPDRSGSSTRPLSSSSASVFYSCGTPNKRTVLDRPKSCTSCRIPSQGVNHRLLNANSIVLGRPESQKATFTSGEHGRRPVDYWPPRDSPAAHGLQDNRGGYRKLTTMIKKFESLGMSPTAPPPRMQRRRPRLKGRNAVEPGKTRVSCRRDSLTNPVVNGKVNSMKNGDAASVAVKAQND